MSKVVKSGGEWISSIDMENMSLDMMQQGELEREMTTEPRIMAMPEIDIAAVVAVPHARWDERPVAADCSATQIACRCFMSSFDKAGVHIQSWMFPPFKVGSGGNTCKGRQCRESLRPCKTAFVLRLRQVPTSRRCPSLLPVTPWFGVRSKTVSRACTLERCGM